MGYQRRVMGTVLGRMKSLILLLGLLLVSGPLVSAWWGDNDSDGDGIKDAEDDDDNDGLLDVNDEDDDGDGILDEDEDLDGDGKQMQRTTTMTAMASWTVTRTTTAMVWKMTKTPMMMVTVSSTKMTSFKNLQPTSN